MANKDRRERKRKKRREKLRRQKRCGQSKLQASSGPEYERQPGRKFPEAAFEPLRMEHDMGRIQKAINEKGIRSEAELKAFLDQLTGHRVEDVLGPADGPEDDAQELTLRAMQTSDPVEADTLAGRALELDPFSVDALSIRAQVQSKSREELVDALRRILDIGKDAMGENFFRESCGRFWGIIETRPFMRAKCLLAQQLQIIGREDETITEREEMLKLNPNDNQGIRLALLGLYLATGRLEEAKRLLEMFDGDSSTVFAWGKVLERHLAGEVRGAESALAAARETNPFVEAFLTGDEDMPAEQPGYFTPGDEVDAHVCALALADAWRRHPDALEWLRSMA